MKLGRNFIEGIGPNHKPEKSPRDSPQHSDKLLGQPANSVIYLLFLFKNYPMIALFI